MYCTAKDMMPKSTIQKQCFKKLMTVMDAKYILPVFFARFFLGGRFFCCCFFFASFLNHYLSNILLFFLKHCLCYHFCHCIASNKVIICTAIHKYY